MGVNLNVANHRQYLQADDVQESKEQFQVIRVIRDESYYGLGLKEEWG